MKKLFFSAVMSLLMIGVTCQAKVITVTSRAQVKEALAKPGPIMVLYSAPWCPFCQRFLPIYKKLSDQVKGVRFYDLDSDKFIINGHQNLFSGIPAGFAAKNSMLLVLKPCRIVDGLQSLAFTKKRLDRCLGLKP